METGLGWVLTVLTKPGRPGGDNDASGARTLHELPTSLRCLYRFALTIAT